MMREPVPKGRRPTPRPVFTEPRLITRRERAHHVWGDAESGFVTDRVIVSSDQLHVLEFDLPPGGEFRHSPANQTVFGADILYYVLEGTLILANPETGEVRRTRAGTGELFHRGTWHNGFSSTAEPLRVLEFFSPPPARGTASTFAKAQTPLSTARYADNRWTGRWPEARAEREASASFFHVDDDLALWTMRDSRASHLVAILVDTPFLSVGHGLVAPGHVEDFRLVEHESVLVVTEGELWVDVWSELGGFQAMSLSMGDAAFLPVGCSERVLVRGKETARYLRGSGHVPEDWVQ